MTITNIVPLRSEVVGRLFVFGVLISMTKAFALTSFFEAMLLLLFVFSSDLRVKLKGALRDSRVVLVLGFWIWIGLTMIWSSAPVDERLADWWSWRKLLLVPFCFVLFERVRHKRLLMAVCISVCLVYLIISWAAFFDLITMPMEASEVLENHGTQGVLFTGSALFCCILAATTERSFLFRVALLTLAVAFAINVLMVGTGRSGYLFLFVVSVVATISIWGPRLSIILLVTGTIALGVNLSDTAKNRINQALDESVTAFDPTSDYTSIGVRVVMWKNTLEVIQQAPIFGVGAGSFKYTYAQVVASFEGWRGSISDDPHQQFLHIFAEYGVIGLVIFLCGLGAIGLSGSNSSFSLGYVALMCVLLGTAANSMANGHFSSFVEGRFAWIFMFALCSGTSDRAGGYLIKRWGVIRKSLGHT